MGKKVGKKLWLVKNISDLAKILSLFTDKVVTFKQMFDIPLFINLNLSWNERTLIKNIH